MPNIEYAPPFHRGVTSIMGVGADEMDVPDKKELLQKAQWVALGTWGVGVLLGSNLLKNAGFGASVLTFLWLHMEKEKTAKQQEAAVVAAEQILTGPPVAVQPVAQGNYFWR